VKFLAAPDAPRICRRADARCSGRQADRGEKRLDVADWRARAGLTWEQVNSIFPKATAPAAITAAVAAVNERFFGKYLPVRDKAYQNLIAAKPLGLSGKEWSDASNPGLDAIVGIRDAAIATGAAHLQESHAAALRSLIVNCALVLIALGLTVTVYVVARSRVSTPLGQIAAALKLVNEGRLDVEFARTRHRQDRRDRRAHPVPRPEPAHARDRAAARGRRAQAADDRNSALADAFRARSAASSAPTTTAGQLAARGTLWDRRDHPAAFRHGDERLGRSLGHVQSVATATGN
jgi:hypothetical protein